MIKEMIRPRNDNVLVDPAAERHEIKAQTEHNAQFLELKRQAQGTFEAIKGRRGASNEEYWQDVVAKAKLDYDSGNFLIGRIGACRQLDLPLVATLLQLRRELLDGIDNPTTGDKMLADSAILAYRNLLRVQGWIGSTALVVQRELFGQEPLESSHGYGEAMQIEKRVNQLEQVIMPLLDRAQRMMIRALDRLEARRCGKPNTLVSIGTAGQVNVGSKVRNVLD
jgi:hypothetical protein